jgi:hypothetical protein
MTTQWISPNRAKGVPYTACTVLGGTQTKKTAEHVLRPGSLNRWREDRVMIEPTGMAALLAGSWTACISKAATKEN